MKHYRYTLAVLLLALLSLGGILTAEAQFTPQAENSPSASLPIEARATLQMTPTVTSITPNHGSGLVHITDLSGNDFEPGASVVLTRAGYTPITATQVTVVSSTTITGELDLRGAAVGVWNVAVINPGDEIGQLDNGFTVAAAIYMPVVLNQWPPIPDVPVLGPIDNIDGDGNYTVTWNVAPLATTYTLQEDTSPAFTNPTMRYTGAGTQWVASGKSPGTYYYRVQAANGWGSSNWSNVQSAAMWSAKLLATASANVLSLYPNSYRAGDFNLWAGYHWAPCENSHSNGGISRSFLQFDVSSIPSGVPIAKATLNARVLVSCWNAASPATERLVTLYRLTAPWEQYTVTWNTQPGMAEPYGTAVIPRVGGEAKWYSFDVTDLVRGWVNGGFPNDGVAFTAPENAGDDRVFFSFYGIWSADYAPYLSLTYSVAAEGGQSTSVDIRLPLRCQVSAQRVTVCSPGSGLPLP